jgi:hypothetical protein
MATHYPVPRNVKASEVEESEASRIDFLDVYIKEIHLRYIMLRAPQYRCRPAG